MTLKLLADQVLVKPLRQLERFEARTASGLFMPQNPERDRKHEFFWIGEVVEIGPGDKWRFRETVKEGLFREAYIPKHGGRFPMEVEVGDKVLFERRPWGDIMIDGQEYTVLHEEQHIAGVIEEE